MYDNEEERDRPVLVGLGASVVTFKLGAHVGSN